MGPHDTFCPEGSPALICLEDKAKAFILGEREYGQISRNRIIDAARTLDPRGRISHKPFSAMQGKSK